MRPEPDKDDRVHLHEVLVSARQAVKYVQGLTFEQLSNDAKTRDAVAMRLHIIGKAAGQLSHAGVTAVPTVAMHLMCRRGNYIAQIDNKVEFKLVWAMVQSELKFIISETEKYFLRLERMKNQTPCIQSAPSAAVLPPRPSNGPRMGM